MEGDEGVEPHPEHQTGPQQWAQQERGIGQSEFCASKSFELGIPFLTGSIQLELPETKIDSYSSGDNNPIQRERSLFRLRVKLPCWLSSKALDSVVKRTYSGWLHQLTIYNVFDEASTVWKQAMLSSSSGDISSLKRLFEDRKIGPKDRDQKGRGLFTVCNPFLFPTKLPAFN